jgi:hypothetical protein
MLLVYKLSLHQIDRIANILHPASTVGGKRQKISFKKYKSRNYPLSDEEKGRKNSPDSKDAPLSLQRLENYFSPSVVINPPPFRQIASLSWELDVLGGNVLYISWP